MAFSDLFDTRTAEQKNNDRIYSESVNRGRNMDSVDQEVHGIFDAMTSIIPSSGEHKVREAGLHEGFSQRKSSHSSSDNSGPGYSSSSPCRSSKPSEPGELGLVAKLGLGTITVAFAGILFLAGLQEERNKQAKKVVVPDRILYDPAPYVKPRPKATLYVLDEGRFGGIFINPREAQEVTTPQVISSSNSLDTVSIYGGLYEIIIPSSSKISMSQNNSYSLERALDDITPLEIIANEGDRVNFQGHGRQTAFFRNKNEEKAQRLTVQYTTSEGSREISFEEAEVISRRR
jgi:hypothetical protein